MGRWACIELILRVRKVSLGVYLPERVGSLTKDQAMEHLWDAESFVTFCSFILLPPVSYSPQLTFLEHFLLC
jgi:hypothetical protein